MTGQGRGKDQGSARGVSLQGGWSQSDIVPSARTRESYCDAALAATTKQPAALTAFTGWRSRLSVGATVMLAGIRDLWRGMWDKGALTWYVGSGASDVL